MITQSPDPAVPGQSVKVCLNINGLNLPVTLNGCWDPGAQVFSHTVTGANDNCWTETVPDNAEGGLIEDPNSQVKPFAVSVAP